MEVVRVIGKTICSVVIAASGTYIIYNFILIMLL